MPGTDSVVKVLQESDLFNGIGASSLRSVVLAGNVRKIISGGIIFLEGSSGSSFFTLIEGTVKLLKTTPGGAEMTVKILSPRETFAETVLFENDSYPVTAKAIEDSTVFALSRPAFLQLLETRGFRDEFITVLMKKQRYLADRILYLTAYDVEQRFFKFLEERFGRRGEYEMDMSKKEIAAAIGTIPETLSRLLAGLKRRKVLSWNGRKIKLSDGFWDGKS